MKIICFGTPFFTSQIIRNISDDHEILCVVTTEDTQQGRGKRILPSDVKKTANELNIPLLQPKHLNDKEFITDLINYNADLFLVVAFRKLPKDVWNIPRKGTINLHTSLLPQYRGAGPINWVLINGENKTGLTTFFINDKIDQGDIILQKEVCISENMTAGQLHNQMIKDGSKLIIETLQLIDENRVTLKLQSEENNFKNAPKIKKEFLKIDWEDSLEDIHNKIRGLSPFVDKNEMLKDVSICPCAWFYLNNKRVKVQKSSICNIVNRERYIDTDNKNYLNINFKDKALSLEFLQIEGKKPMSISQFLQGNKINSSDKIN